MKINEAYDWFVNKCINDNCGEELWDLPNFVENDQGDLIFEYTCKKCGSQYKCFFDSEAYWDFNIHQWSKSRASLTLIGAAAHAKRYAFHFTLDKTYAMTYYWLSRNF